MNYAGSWGSREGPCLRGSEVVGDRWGHVGLGSGVQGGAVRGRDMSPPTPGDTSLPVNLLDQAKPRRTSPDPVNIPNREFARQSIIFREVAGL